MAVDEMERRGIVGTAGLYYDLARCLCSAGRCSEALKQVRTFLTCRKLWFTRYSEVNISDHFTLLLCGAYQNLSLFCSLHFHFLFCRLTRSAELQINHL